MCQELTDELAAGKAAATTLAKHLLMMGAARASIPGDLDGKRFMVTAEWLDAPAAPTLPQQLAATRVDGRPTMQPGDRVLARIPGRADGKVGGWQWRDWSTTVIAVRRVTALVQRDGWDQLEVVKLERLTPVAPHRTTDTTP